jgi:hypothetical protein
VLLARTHSRRELLIVVATRHRSFISGIGFCLDPDSLHFSLPRSCLPRCRSKPEHQLPDSVLSGRTFCSLSTAPNPFESTTPWIHPPHRPRPPRPPRPLRPPPEPSRGSWFPSHRTTDRQRQRQRQSRRRAQGNLPRPLRLPLRTGPLVRPITKIASPSLFAGDHFKAPHRNTKTRAY